MAWRKSLPPLVLLALAAAVVAGRALLDGAGPAAPAAAGGGGAQLADAFAAGRSGVVVEASGEVVRTLEDDLDGSRHQRFVVRLASGQTLLIAHNIDLAPRVPAGAGDRVEFRGQYEWNERGGVIHWTHADPGGGRPGGWIRHRGRVYR